MQKFREAAEYYTKVLDLEHFDNGFVFELLCSRASAQSKIGNFRGAINDCDRALVLCPSDVNMRLLRANCYHYLDDFKNAIEDFEVALNADEVKMNSKQTGKIQSKINDLKKALRREDAKKWKNRGDKLVAAKKFEDAFDAFARAINLWPENLSFYEDRANCFIVTNDFKGAINEYQSALAIDGSFLKGYYGVIKCYLITGDIFSAETTIKHFNSSISKNDDIVNGYQKQFNELRSQESLANDRYIHGLYGLARKRFKKKIRSIKFNCILKCLFYFQFLIWTMH